MATQYEVTGPSSIQTGTGSSEALEPLGLCEDGAEIAIHYEEQGIITDAGGRVPTEIQQMGTWATIDMRLPVKDLAVLAKIIRRSEGSATIGQGGTPGALLGTGAFLFQLYIPSSTGTIWNFPKCKLESKSGRYGTKYTADVLRFKAIRWIAGTAATTAAAVLFTNAAP